MRIVDFHTHFFARPFFDALASLSPLPGDVSEKLELVRRRTGIDIPPDDLGEHLSRWLGELDDKGVEHLVTFSSLPQETDAVADAAARSAGRITPMALANPLADGAADTVRRLLAEKGFKGVLLFPAMHHFHVGGPECRAVLQTVDEAGGVVYVHCGLLVVKLRDILGIPRPYDLSFSNPLGVIPAANAFPNVKFVIPHFGAGFFRESLMAGAQCPNVCIDTSSTNSWITTQPAPTTLMEVFDRALGVFGVDRILFGTDSNVFPAGWRTERFEEQRTILGDLALTAEDQQKIFAGNADGVIGRGLEGQ